MAISSLILVKFGYILDRKLPINIAVWYKDLFLRVLIS